MDQVVYLNNLIHHVDVKRESFISSFPTPDGAEGNVKDKVYQTAGIVHTVIPDSSGIVHTVIPDSSGSAFFVREIPNQVGNDITDKSQGDSGSSTGMTEDLRMKALTRPPIRSRVTLRIRFIKMRESFIPSFPTPDQVEGDVKDKVYQTAGIAFKNFAKNVFT